MTGSFSPSICSHGAEHCGERQDKVLCGTMEAQPWTQHEELFSLDPITICHQWMDNNQRNIAYLWTDLILLLSTDWITLSAACLPPPPCTYPSALLSLVVYLVQGGLGCLPRRAVLLQSYLLTIIDSEELGEKEREWERGKVYMGGNGGIDVWSPAQLGPLLVSQEGRWSIQPRRCYFGQQGLLKHPLTHPLSFFHYLLTFRVARQPRSVTAFDFKCSLLTRMKNAYLAEPRRNACVKSVYGCECECVQLLVCQRENEMGDCGS